MDASSLMRGLKKITGAAILFLSVAWTTRAQSWQPTATPATLWTGLACSADASVIAASVQGPSVYISLDSGTTWTSNFISAAAGYFIANVAMSADGSHICAPNFNSGGGIVTSSNFGNTWLTHPTPVPFRTLALSADGQRIAAAPLNHVAGMFTSADFGATWTSNQTANTSWNSIACSADGSKLAAPIPFTAFVMNSTNYGVTWTTNGVFHASCLFIASSADGSRLITGGNTQIPGSIFISTNGGQKWNATGLSNAAWNFAISSADGSHLLAAVNATMQVSTNSGLTWTPDNSLFTNEVAAQVSSADGAVLIAATGSGSGPLGRIYIKRSIQPPTLNIRAGSTLNFSWLIPSTNFVLQQTTDLATASWAAVTNTPTLNLANLQNQIAIPPPSVPTFYLLSHE